MPTYQYTCTECATDLEAVQKFTDDALTDCPECQGRLRKVFSAVGVVFKGSGFYRTDSRAKSSASDVPGSSKSESSSKDSSSKSESAPAKSESAPKKNESSKKSEPAKKSESAA